jgi:hypothetical protein
MSTRGSVTLPDTVIDDIRRKHCVLFLGSDDDFSTPDWSGAPSRARLSAALSRAYDWVGERRSLHVAAEEFLSREPANYHQLIAFVRERTLEQAKPGPIHHLLNNLKFNAIVSNLYDDLLETMLQAAGRRVLQIVGDTEIAYTSGRDDEVIIIRLAGTVSQPETLVLTQEDQIQVQNHLSARLQAIRSWLALHPLLFIGWDPDDDGLRRLYQAATEKLGKHRRRNYIVWPNPSERLVANWNRLNVEIITATPLAFLQGLQEAIARAEMRESARGARGPVLTNKIPYKFLDYYDVEDQDIFYGRSAESQIVYRLALSYRLLTIFGQSGVGKTSLLQAGVIPLLLQAGYTHVYVRIAGDPLQAIRQEVSLRFHQPPSHQLPDLQSFFRQVLDRDTQLVVILDQVEELFTRPVSSMTRRQFWHELGECLTMTDIDVCFILVLREEYLAYLDEARQPGPTASPAPVPMILQHSYRLKALDAEAAYQAIVEPARNANCEIDPSLIDVLVGQDMAREEFDIDSWSLLEHDGTVAAPCLQIVMDKLYRFALKESGHAPPSDTTTGWQPPNIHLSLVEYQALGGARRILAGYVSEALDRVTAYGGERVLAVALLKLLVTSQATKLALEEAELPDAIAAALPSVHVIDDLGAMRTTRDALVQLRLLRSFRVGNRVFYELAHDYMAKEIATWVSDEELQLKLARELLRQEMENWRRFRLLISPEVLRIIHERRDVLQFLSADELELLFRSALGANYEAAYWARRAKEKGVNPLNIVREGLQDPNFRIRSAAAAALKHLPDEEFIAPLAAMLSDPYPQVRMSAIRSLESHRSRESWQAIVDNLRYERFVPAGVFTMGDDTGGSDEHPVHNVDLPAFYICRFPVTNADYKRYMDDIGRAFDPHEDRLDHPLVVTTWYEASEYADWAQMRLLTEAEWEKAAGWDPQTQSKRRYPWGDAFDPLVCNTAEGGHGLTTPDGTFSPGGDSPYGCADMVGNVWEWTSSLYKEYPYDPHDGREDSANSSLRVLRGGSFSSYQDAARVSFRGWNDPMSCTWYEGFRLGATATPFSQEE